MQNQETSILIAEDDPEILSLLENIFSKHFNKIYTAANGRIAHSIVKESSPDLILTDIRMPELSGMDFIIKMRSEGNNTPVVMISSSKDRDDLMKAIKLGVQAFVEKPFKRVDVEMAIHRVLEIAVRNNDLNNMIFLFGKESKEVKQQRKLIGLLQVISARA